MWRSQKSYPGRLNQQHHHTKTIRTFVLVPCAPMEHIPTHQPTAKAQNTSHASALGTLSSISALLSMGARPDLPAREQLRAVHKDHALNVARKYGKRSYDEAACVSLDPWTAKPSRRKKSPNQMKPAAATSTKPALSVSTQAPRPDESCNFGPRVIFKPRKTLTNTRDARAVARAAGILLTCAKDPSQQLARDYFCATDQDVQLLSIQHA